MYFPRRIFYHVLKIIWLLLVIIALIHLFEQWHFVKLNFMNPEESEFEKQILEDEARIVPGLGEGGVAGNLTGVDKIQGEESVKKLAMHVYMSDRISYKRTLNDKRNPSCQHVTYDADLPSASVILIFYNEPYSVVVRTIWSVINSCRRTNPWFQQANFVDSQGKVMNVGYPGQDSSSPFVYIKEIILVDDNSTLPELQGKLKYYIKTRLPPDLIKIIRVPSHVGLTRARLVGARNAVGDVLVFLDSHCEAQPDWLRPQLQAIKDDPHVVTVPMIDSIDNTDFSYAVDDYDNIQIGGFTFDGHFNWIDVPDRENKRRSSDIAPIRTPTMAGGLFAINRAYFWELGAYDEQMGDWGGENLEISFRIWQCGGTLVTIPCSRVGHVFRNFHPYDNENSDSHGINTARMAEVWMDEYKELFYMHRPDLRNSPKIGDLKSRKFLREKLQCKSFHWYLDNIYKERFVPIRDAYAYGRFQNSDRSLCLDTLQRKENEALGLYSCYSTLQSTQNFILSLEHELRTDEDCTHAEEKEASSQNVDDGIKVIMATCHGKQTERKWTYNSSSEQIQHSDGMCLDASSGQDSDVLLRPCTDSSTQRWRIDYNEDNNYRMSDDTDPNGHNLEKLDKLRSLREHKHNIPLTAVLHKP